MLLIVFFTVSMSVQRMLVMHTGEGMSSESGCRCGKACKTVLLKGVFCGGSSAISFKKEQFGIED